jgi:hypothetical protein
VNIEGKSFEGKSFDKKTMASTRSASQAASSAARRESVNNALLAKNEDKMKKTENDKTPKSKTKSPTTKHAKNIESIDESDTSLSASAEMVSITGIKGLFKEFDASIDKKLEKFEDRFSSVLREFQKDVQTVRQEVTEAKSEVKEIKVKMSELEKSVAFHSDQAEERETLYEAKFNRAKAQIDELERKMLLQEKHDRRYNLLFYGFTEDSEENLSEVMKTFFRSKLELEEDRVNKMVFANIHRMPTESKGPKPVIIKFSTMADRDLVFSKAFHSTLRDERKRILTDLPVAMKRERGRLAQKAYELRKDENLKTRIQESGLSVYLEVRKTAGDLWERRDV